MGEGKKEERKGEMYQELGQSETARCVGNSKRKGEVEEEGERLVRDGEEHTEWRVVRK